MIWFTSDHHFGHANFLRFKDEKGQLIRPFGSVEEMDETMISRWNERISDSDKVYHLGDFTFDYNSLSRIMPRLKGKKRLILGNHDILKGTDLHRYFKKIQMWRIFKDEGFMCTHVPIHRSNFHKTTLLNVHGHIHQNDSPGPEYMNVCVERTDYYPIPMDDILKRVREVRESYIDEMVKLDQEMGLL